jgi:hypothetical protein
VLVNREGKPLPKAAFKHFPVQKFTFKAEASACNNDSIAGYFLV